jgi:predicted PurR-regulated permease PerM
MVTIDPTQWAQLTDALTSLESRLSILQDYITNQFVFVVWGTLALLFIMAIMFYFMFRRPRR